MTEFSYFTVYIENYIKR